MGIYFVIVTFLWANAELPILFVLIGTVANLLHNFNLGLCVGISTMVMSCWSSGKVR